MFAVLCFDFRVHGHRFCLKPRFCIVHLKSDCKGLTGCIRSVIQNGTISAVCFRSLNSITNLNRTVKYNNYNNIINHRGS